MGKAAHSHDPESKNRSLPGAAEEERTVLEEVRRSGEGTRIDAEHFRKRRISGPAGRKGVRRPKMQGRWRSSSAGPARVPDSPRRSHARPASSSGWSAENARRAAEELREAALDQRALLEGVRQTMIEFERGRS